VWAYVTQHGHSLQKDGTDATAFIRRHRDLVIFLDERGVTGQDIGQLLCNGEWGESLN
jgi:hypothetical protein